MQPPTPEELESIMQSPAWLQRAAEFSTENEDMTNTGNYTACQVALALHEWSTAQGHPLRLGIFIEGAEPMLTIVPDHDGNVDTLWIHNNNAAPIAHYSGLRSLIVAPEVVSIWVKGGNTFVNTAHSEEEHLDTQAPQSYREAMKSDEANQWRAAMQSEFESICENDVYTPVHISEVPRGRRILTARWVYKKKLGIDNQVVRYKARWVARGFQQIYGQDFDETYAAVVKGASYKLLLAIAAMTGALCHLMDVKTAFLNGILEEDIYIMPPEGFEGHFPKDHVLKLTKTLYGLKQSPRQWYKRLKDLFVSQGWKVSFWDTAIFFDGKGSIIAAYVDDLLILAPTLGRINEIKAMLSYEFQMSDLGECKLYLGMTVDRTEQGIKIHHRRYIEEVLDRFDLHNIRKYATPMEVCTKLKLDKDPGANACDKKQYQEMVGCLNYIATTIRFDIANSTSIVSRFTSSPNMQHMAAVMRILGYLSLTKDVGLFYQSKCSDGLHALSDSDWGGCPDTYRSTTGFMVRLGTAPISWMSKRQTLTAQSTCEAEYVAASEATRELIWTRNLLDELGFKLTGPSVLFMDNEAARKLAHNPEFHAKTKHIGMKYHLIREQTLAGNIAPQYVPTADNLADLLTKPLPRPAYESLRDRSSGRMKEGVTVTEGV